MTLPPTDTPLTQAWRDWAANAGHGVANSYGTGIPSMDPMREAFFAGAATMAMLIMGDRPVFAELEALKQLLAEQVKNGR